MELPEDKRKEMQRIKDYFPFRIVFAVLDKDTGEINIYAKTTKHVINNNLRKGNKVFILEGGE